MTDTFSHLGNVLIVIEVNFFLLEGADESFSIPVLPKPLYAQRDLNVMPRECRDIRI